MFSSFSPALRTSSLKACFGAASAGACARTTPETSGVGGCTRDKRGGRLAEGVIPKRWGEELAFGGEDTRKFDLEVVLMDCEVEVRVRDGT